MTKLTSCVGIARENNYGGSRGNLAVCEGGNVLTANPEDFAHFMNPLTHIKL